MSIVLSTLNARYHHSSFGLRYLAANLGPLQKLTTIKEYVIKTDPLLIAEELIALNPSIIGFGVYIWNCIQTIPVIKHIRKLNPNIIIVAGGPEVSFETEKQEYFELCNYIFKGESEFIFRDFCDNYINKNILPQNKIISGPIPEITEIALPYSLYTDEDIKNRIIYVEASRGCPYKCEYCLSSLDKSVRNFNIDLFLEQINQLILRGVRQFKFVDRTFNLSPSVSQKILQFFLDKIELGLFLHFEMVPDRLPDELKEQIKKFPKGSLQFEIGIQTWNPDVAKNVSRRQDYEKIKQNLQFLNRETGVHSHADLIVGLPGENLESFAKGFDELASLKPDEIQVGILKRLRGTPIVRHQTTFTMKYANTAPYQIISTNMMSDEDIKTMERFASYWDKIANSGKWNHFFTKFKQVKVDQSFFYSFLDLSEFLWKQTNKTHSLSMEELSQHLFNYGIEKLNLSAEELKTILYNDMKAVGFKYFPTFLADQVPLEAKTQKNSNLPKRQRLHTQSDAVATHRKNN